MIRPELILKCDRCDADIRGEDKFVTITYRQRGVHERDSKRWCRVCFKIKTGEVLK